MLNLKASIFGKPNWPGNHVATLTNLAHERSRDVQADVQATTSREEVDTYSLPHRTPLRET